MSLPEFSAPSTGGNALPSSQAQTLDDVTVRLPHPTREGAGRPPAPPPTRWKPPSVRDLQARLPHIEILRLVGRGGMGAVYHGRQISLDRPVALKILPPELGADDDLFAGRFRNEARAMARLNHPGIVNVHDFGESADGLRYIVMEFVEGSDVARLISKQGCLPASQAVPMIMKVCEALHYAHERGIVHRDIKPSNILIGADGGIKVADFGLAKVRVAGQSQPTTSDGALGTLHFMAPESFAIDAVVDRRADVYAVGVMLYQMLTARLPHGLFDMPSASVPGLDVRYDDIISRALRVDRTLRYQSTEELRQALAQVSDQAPLPAGEEHGHGMGWFL
ncbi:serine/threonine-protein kinase [Prosthecobacter sp.]|uniref:serine/threonine-protein kinase n=1 Tax=Prosthecobacter sp. TaxID=1965333 RepID=UPI003783B012